MNRAELTEETFPAFADLRSLEGHQLMLLVDSVHELKPESVSGATALVFPKAF